MVSVVPSIIPILTANAVDANQVKRKNKSLNNNEKKLKDSPLNNKINCRVFLNNGKVIEGHYEGNWYEDNSDEEGIWIKTDNGIKEINSKDYDRVEYYHKKTVKESSFDNEINNILKNAGVQLNESYDRMDRPFIWNDPTYSQFHRILRDNTTYGKLSAIIDNGHIYCWDSALSHHDSVVKDIEESGIKLSDDYIWVRFKEPNLCWVSAAYFDDYTDEDLEDLPQQNFEKELEDNPIIRKYFPQGVKVVRFDSIRESVLNEELIHMEKSSYDEHLASIVKNPTKRELRENHLKRSRFICFADGTWLFFDPMEWIHEQVLNKYAPKFGRGKNSGFYDYDKNQFIFIHGMNYDEGEDGYEEEFNHYANKDRKFLLSYPYIKQTFGTDFNIMVYGDWVDSPW